jgi:glutathione synthase
VNGKIMASALRLPAENSWLCNVAQGGYSVPAVANANERKIIQRLMPVLREQGVVVFGADTLSNDRGKRVLSEINTLSIGGFPQAQEQTGRPVLKQTIRLLIQYIDERFSLNRA